MNYLLKFRDEQLERQFWHHPRVVGALCTIDKLAFPTVVVNKLVTAYLIYTTGQRDVQKVQAFLGTLMLMLQAAAMWPLLRHRDWYYARRTPIMFAHRALRLVMLYTAAAMYLNGHKSGKASLKVMHARLMGSRPATSVYAVLKFVTLSGALMNAWIMCFTFPLSFAHQYLLAVLALPGLLLQSHISMLVINRPEFVPAVCAVHGRLRSLAAPMRLPAAALGVALPPQACPSAPASRFLVYWFAVVFGVLLPLMVVYVSEFRLRLAFLDDLLHRTQRPGDGFAALLLKAAFCTAIAVAAFTWCLEWCVNFAA